MTRFVEMKTSKIPGDIILERGSAVGWGKRSEPQHAICEGHLAGVRCAYPNLREPAMTCCIGMEIPDDRSLLRKRGAHSLQRSRSCGPRSRGIKLDFRIRGNDVIVRGEVPERDNPSGQESKHV